MRLKIMTTAALVIGLALPFLWAYLLAHHPSLKSPVLLRKRFAEELLLIDFGMIVCLVTAGTGAVLIVRQVRAEYRNQMNANLTILLEGTSKVHVEPNVDQDRS